MSSGTPPRTRLVSSPRTEKSHCDPLLAKLDQQINGFDQIKIAAFSTVGEEMRFAGFLGLFLLAAALSGRVSAESVVWVVQLSDLHLSAHHPDRAIDFSSIVGPALRLINPSLVFITGDLTDGKSKDMLVMKQNEEEWIEYQNVLQQVVESSGLDVSLFYDIRGNHDNFGVPGVGSSLDFFSKYSINGRLGRRSNVNSVTVETGDRKHLFVAVDSTMAPGLRGPTNLFGHPSDELLSELDSQLSQWDSQSEKPVSKIVLGHFPLSFSASSRSGKSLKDVFLKHTLSAYLCGHLHAKFGRNLKRHHTLSPNSRSYQELFQTDIHQIPYGTTANCSFGAPSAEEFWEWEMGDWRKSRAMRMLAIDKGHVSYVDIDFRKGAKKTIILPTFPLDSRFMSTSSSHQMYECQHMIPSSFETVRALVFSSSPVLAVVARIYDSRPGILDTVLETPMTKLAEYASKGNVYAAPWNYKAFEDPSPDRFWLQIEVVDAKGLSTLSELRPFSINGLNAKISWTWKEFVVMGCQWDALYYPIFWSCMSMLLIILLVPKVILVLLKKQFTYKSFVAKRGILHAIAWVFQDLCRLPIPYFGFILYLLHMLVFPLFIGRIFSEGHDKGFMTYMGWIVRDPNDKGKHGYVGSPDVMVVILPHLCFVVFPAIVVAGALAVERSIYKEHMLSISGKKEDDYVENHLRISIRNKHGARRLKSVHQGRWIRIILLAACVAIGWKHFKCCRAMMKAYDMNLLIGFPVYGLVVPALLVYTAYKTWAI